MQSPVDNFSIHDQSYNHYMEHHIDPTDHYHDHTHTVYTKPVDATPKFQFLAYNNYLNEFKSEVDKARVRFNLGIPDQFSFNWGNIQGSIEEQQDLIQFINSKTEGNKNWRSSVDTKIQDINTQIGLLSNRLGGTANSSEVENIADSLQGIRTEINKLWTDVADNSREVTNLYKLVSGEEFDSSFLTDFRLLQNQVSSIQNTLPTLPTSSQFSTISGNLDSLSSRVQQLEANSSTSEEINTLKAQVAALQMAIGANELKELTLNINSDALQNLTTDASDIEVLVTANYTKIDPVNVTEECQVIVSNQTVAVWTNNKIHIIGNGSTTFTFSFRGKSTSLNIRVGQEIQPQTQLSYIGWASNYTQILKNSDYETSNIAKTWNDLNLKVYGNTYPTYLWACVPQGTIISKVSYGGIEDIPSIGEVADGYNIYYLGYASSSINGTSLTITTQNG